MRISLERFKKTPYYTIGRLVADGHFLCYTLEDAEREIEGQPVEQWKQYSKTAIPRGTYRVVRTLSPRFRKTLPLLLDVPGFTGIRIHPGNTSTDTDGCILPGTEYTGGDWVGNSRAAFSKLDRRIKAALDKGQRVELTIT